VRLNPPCYRCESTVPLEGGRVGLCRKCELEVRAEANAEPTTPTCSQCGHFFVNDWERIQHLVRNRHNYRAWTSEDGARAAEKMTRKDAA
jgi:hypothetical protein